MWRSRGFTNSVRYVLDDLLPPVVREMRWLAVLMGRVFHGPNFDVDFKRRAPTLSDEQFAAAYTKLAEGRTGRYRPTDMTERQMDWVLREAIPGDVLEVGCGYGILSQRLAARPDFRVTATDLCEPVVESLRSRLADQGLSIATRVANLERLPFDDKSFDTTVCAHTLEHVLRFEQSVAELIRVTRRRLLIVVPCQRYYRYTIDYHLHFFPEAEQLTLRTGSTQGVVERIDRDLCLRADLPATVKPETRSGSVPLSGAGIGGSGDITPQ